MTPSQGQLSDWVEFPVFAREYPRITCLKNTLDSLLLPLEIVDTFCIVCEAGHVGVIQMLAVNVSERREMAANV